MKEWEEESTDDDDTFEGELHQTVFIAGGRFICEGEDIPSVMLCFMANDDAAYDMAQGVFDVTNGNWDCFSITTEAARKVAADLLRMADLLDGKE